MNDFERYQHIKSQYRIHYKGYALDRILALTLWLFSNGKLSFKPHYFAKIFLAYSFKDIRFDSNSNEILSTFGRYDRKDHLEVYNYVTSMLGPTTSRNILIYPKRCACFNFRTMYFVIKNCCPVVAGIKNLSVISKFSLLLETIFWCNTIDVLLSKDFVGIKKYLCFCDVLDLENLLTQHFKKIGIPTYSLTHGTHHIIHKSPEPGMLGYENLETEHLLLWGQYSIDQYASWGINKDRLYLAGYPKESKQIGFKISSNNKRCMVLLSQHYFYETNMRLLNILLYYSNQYDFTIKPHPAAVEYYKTYAESHGMKILNSNETIDKCLNQDRFDWCIAVNTGAYYEALMRGVRCLRYSDGSFDLQPGYDDIFEDKEEFDIKIKEILNKPIEKYQNEIDNVLKYTYGIGINNYHKIVVGS